MASVDFEGFDHTDANEVPGFATLTPQHPLVGPQRLARQVKRSGIDRVRGDVVIDDRLWKQQLVNHEVISPIIINDNVIDVTMNPMTPGEPVEVVTRPATAAYRDRRPCPDRRRRQAARSRRSANRTRGRVIVRARSPPAGRSRRPGGQDPPPRLLREEPLRRRSRKAGVRGRRQQVAPNRVGHLPSQAKLMARPRDALRVSPPVSEFVKLISKVSHNPGANTVPFLIGVATGRPTLAGGCARSALTRGGSESAPTSSRWSTVRARPATDSRRRRWRSCSTTSTANPTGGPS